MIKSSIIIPTYNEERDIKECIKSLLVQTYKDFELIIVDDGSKDKTKEIVKKFVKKDKRVELIEGEHKGPGFSRNLGASKAKGKVLVFVDADMTFRRDFLEKLIKPIEEGKEIGTENLQISNNPKNIWSRCWGLYLNNEPFKGEKGKRGMIFRAILKSKFKKMGGFDSKYGYADDLTFYFKYGLRPLAVFDAICYHKNPATLKEVYKQSKWIGASIRSKWIQNKIAPFFLIVLSPIIVPLLSIKKCYENKSWSLLIPWMLIFMTVRYFGSIQGIINKNYFKKNVR